MAKSFTAVFQSTGGYKVHWVGSQETEPQLQPTAMDCTSPFCRSGEDWLQNLKLPQLPQKVGHTSNRRGKLSAASSSMSNVVSVSIREFRHVHGQSVARKDVQTRAGDLSLTTRDFAPKPPVLNRQKTAFFANDPKPRDWRNDSLSASESLQQIMDGWIWKRRFYPKVQEHLLGQ